jgi:hypothetical protein
MLEGRILYAQMIVDEWRREQRELTAPRHTPTTRVLRINPRHGVRRSGNR